VSFRRLASDAAPGATASRRLTVRTPEALTSTLAGWRLPRAVGLAFLAHLAVVFAAAAMAVAFAPARQQARPRLEGLAHFLVEPLAIWDGGWYAEIAADGYGARPQSAAFWPLYPLLLRAGDAVTDWGVPTVGVLLSNVAFLAALVVLHRLVRAETDEQLASRTVWLLALFPTAVFFSAVYTESLFLLCSAGSIACGRKGKWLAAGTFGALAAATRNTGILVLLPLGVMLLRDRGSSPQRLWRPALALVPIFLGPALFAWHLDQLWGDPLLPIHARKYWGRSTAWPWESVASAIGQRVPGYWSGTRELATMLMSARFGEVGPRLVELMPHPAGVSGHLALLMTVPALALLPVVFWRLGLAYGLYSLALLWIPLANPGADNPLLSMPRYLLAVFPLFVALAILLGQGQIYRSFLAVSALACGGLTVLFAQAYFVA
jgi:hypothetical protein